MRVGGRTIFGTSHKELTRGINIRDKTTKHIMAIRTVRQLDDEEWEQFMGELNRDSTPEEEALMHKMIKLSKDLNLIK